VHQSVCRQPGLFDAPESPDYYDYTINGKKMQQKWEPKPPFFTTD